MTCPATIASQGMPAGERVLIQFETTATHLKTLGDLGMRDSMQEQLAKLLERPKGFVLFSAPAAGGLRTTMNVVLHGEDRFLREFVTIEEETNPYREVENIHLTTYAKASGQSPASVLPKVFRSEPHVVLVSRSGQRRDGRLDVPGSDRGQPADDWQRRAKDTTDALPRAS